MLMRTLKLCSCYIRIKSDIIVLGKGVVYYTEKANSQIINQIVSSGDKRTISHLKRWRTCT